MNKNKRIIVVEDEFLIAEGILADLDALGYQAIRPHCSDYEQALSMIEKEQPDLVLLDIRLNGEKTGVDVAEQIQTRFRIPYLFLTANFNPNLFQTASPIKPAGVLTKPFHRNNLFATIEFAFMQAIPQTEEKIVLPGAQKKESIAQKDILFAKAEQNYCRIYLENREILCRISLRELLESLSAKWFQQTHRSYLINLRHVHGFKAGSVFVGSEKVPIGRAYKDEILHRLRND